MSNRSAASAAALSSHIAHGNLPSVRNRRAVDAQCVSSVTLGIAKPDPLCRAREPSGSATSGRQFSSTGRTRDNTSAVFLHCIARAKHIVFERLTRYARPPAKDPTMTEFTRRHLKINGIDTVVLEAGSGSPLVYLHGAGTVTGFDFAAPLAR